MRQRGAPHRRAAAKNFSSARSKRSSCAGLFSTPCLDARASACTRPRTECSNDRNRRCAWGPRAAAAAAAAAVAARLALLHGAMLEERYARSRRMEGRETSAERAHDRPIARHEQPR